MKMEIIKVGDTVNTAVGYVEILGEHISGDLRVNEYEINEDGTATMVFEDTIMKRSELNAQAKELDGRNHNYWLMEDADE